MFKGIQKNSLVDYPGKIALTLFTGGCNFRCPWCHNRDLVFPETCSNLPDLDEGAIRNAILKRKGFIDGVCITGGEPTIWDIRLGNFLRWVKEEGLLVKLDTNGYRPDVIRSYLQNNLIDFIAMDIKSSEGNYRRATGLESIDFRLIRESIQLIKSEAPAYQFRTTMVPGLINADEVALLEKEHAITIHQQKYRETSRAW
jgi:pyruvate formate lyase activating enzyme